MRKIKKLEERITIIEMELEKILEWIDNAHENIMKTEKELSLNHKIRKLEKQLKGDSPDNHAPDEIGGTDEGKKGQAWADNLGDELPES